MLIPDDGKKKKKNANQNLAASGSALTYIPTSFSDEIDSFAFQNLEGQVLAFSQSHVAVAVTQSGHTGVEEAPTASRQVRC